MTTTTRIVKAIVTLPILGTVSRDERGEVVKKGESYRIHIYAAKPDWKENKSMRDMFFVGLLEGEGYTSSPFKRSLDVALPEGHVLVALRFDENGCHSWDSLPIHIDQWFSSVGWHLVKDGQIFINDASIQAGSTTHAEITISEEDSVPNRLQKLVSETFKERLNKELRPGGLLYTSGMAVGGYVSQSQRIKELPRCSDYVGLRREGASRKAAELTAIAAKTGQTVALARHLALLVPIIEHG